MLGYGTYLWADAVEKLAVAYPSWGQMTSALGGHSSRRPAQRPRRRTARPLTLERSLGRSGALGCARLRAP